MVDIPSLSSTFVSSEGEACSTVPWVSGALLQVRHTFLNIQDPQSIVKINRRGESADRSLVLPSQAKMCKDSESEQGDFDLAVHSGTDDGSHTKQLASDIENETEQIDEDDLIGNTTLRIRRFPLWMQDPAQVAELLDSLGFGNPRIYDYLYVPVNFKNWGIKGYAFINCTSHSEANRMAAVLATKGHETGWAREQGKVQNVLKYQHTPLNNRNLEDGDVIDLKYHPIIWEKVDANKWLQVPFPPPQRPTGAILANVRLGPLNATERNEGVYFCRSLPPMPKSKSNLKIFISNLLPCVTERQLFIALSPFGALTSLHIVYDSRTKMSKGYAFASFKLASSFSLLFMTIGRNIHTKFVEGHLVLPDGSTAVVKPYTEEKRGRGA